MGGDTRGQTSGSGLTRSGENSRLDTESTDDDRSEQQLVPPGRQAGRGGAVVDGLVVVAGEGIGDLLLFVVLAV